VDSVLVPERPSPSPAHKYHSNDQNIVSGWSSSLRMGWPSWVHSNIFQIYNIIWIIVYTKIPEKFALLILHPEILGFSPLLINHRFFNQVEIQNLLQTIVYWIKISHTYLIIFFSYKSVEDTKLLYLIYLYAFSRWIFLWIDTIKNDYACYYVAWLLELQK